MENTLLEPLVSVLMASYNSEDYIAVAIQSVLKSTYKNFELIITDDNSTDGTYAIAKAYEAKDNRVKVIRNAENYGDYPNRNQAASYATGKYLKYVDHDDYIYPYGLEQLVYYMEQFPDVDSVRPNSISIRVVLPAPFGPNNPKISPSFILRFMLSTAVKSPYCFVKLLVTIMGLSGIFIVYPSAKRSVQWLLLELG